VRPSEGPAGNPGEEWGLTQRASHGALHRDNRGTDHLSHDKAHSPDSVGLDGNQLGLWANGMRPEQYPASRGLHRDNWVFPCGIAALGLCHPQAWTGGWEPGQPGDIAVPCDKRKSRLASNKWDSQGHSPAWARPQRRARPWKSRKVGPPRWRDNKPATSQVEAKLRVSFVTLLKHYNVTALGIFRVQHAVRP